MLDFQQLKATVPITQVLGMLEITHLTERGDVLRGCCPLCKHEDTRAFIVTPAKNTFYCFKEKQGGDQIRLVARSRDLKDREAAQWIADKGAGKGDDNARPQQEVADGRKPSTFDPLKYQAALDPDHQSLTYDGAALRHFGGGYHSGAGVHRGRLALPIYNGKKEIAAFVSLSPDGSDYELKYHKGYEPPFFMGHEHVGSGTLYLAAHPCHMLTAYEGGVENVVALLRPLNADCLVCLTALMREKNCDTLEFI